MVSKNGIHGLSGMSKSPAWPRDYYPLVFAILMREEEVADIGQFDARQRRYLELAVKRGGLFSKRKVAGPYPKSKTCYACPNSILSQPIASILKKYAGWLNWMREGPRSRCCQILDAINDGRQCSPFNRDENNARWRMTLRRGCGKVGCSLRACYAAFVRHYILLILNPAVLAAIGYLLDKAFHYSKPAIYDKYTDWWFSLSELTLEKLNRFMMRSLLKVDYLLLQKEVLSLNSFVRNGRIISGYLVGSHKLLLRGTHSLEFNYTSAWVFTIIMFPSLLFIITVIRVLIRYLAKKDSPLSTKIYALFLLLGFVLFDVATAHLEGDLITWVPFYEYGHLTPVEQAYTIISACNLVGGVENLMYHVELTPFYFYLLVGSFVFLMYVIAKFLERYFASEAEESNAKFFTSAGVLIGIIGDAIIFIVIPSIVYTGTLMADMEKQALDAGFLASAVNIGHSIEDKTQRASYAASLTALAGLLTDSQNSPDPLQTTLDQGMKGSAILYKWYTGKEPPPQLK